MKMNQDINNVCKEVISILAYFDDDVIEKIPSKILIKINELAADSNVDYYIDTEKGLLDQQISEKSKDLIALIYYSYIANENEKYELSKIWNDNEKEYQKELHKKYNPDNLFKNEAEQNSSNIENSNTALIEYKESFFAKLKEFVFKILHINN